MTMRQTTCAKREAGFTLIEALTALLVVAFGMLAIAGFQVSLSGSSDIAKQRSEAVRLAQLKIEELRAYQQVASHFGTPHIFNYTDDVVSGNDAIGPSNGSYATNTTYARAWTVTGGAADLQKWVRVAVSWTDRNNTVQTVNLHTVIARADPVSIGTLAVGPGGSKTRSPKDRNVNIPYPAVSLADGRSGFQPSSDSDPNPNPFYVFDNVTGEVLGYCSTEQAAGSNVVFPGEESDGGTPTSGCIKQKAYLLAGYVRFVRDSNPQLSAFVNPTGETGELSIALDLTVASTSVPNYQCFAQRQRVVTDNSTTDIIRYPQFIAGAVRSGNTVTVTTEVDHGFQAGQYITINSPINFTYTGTFKIDSVPTARTFTYTQLSMPGGPAFVVGPPKSSATQVQQVTIPESAPLPPGYNSQPVSRFVAYTCIVFPAADTSTTPGPDRWTGSARIVPVGWTIGTTSSDLKICRYTGDYVPGGTVSNSEHPLVYRGVTGALDSQNYVAIRGNNNCPTDSAANPLATKYTNVNTTVHQTDNTLAGGARSGTNPGNQNNNGGFTEAEPTSGDSLPMF